jgi:hypothetical protein
LESEARLLQSLWAWTREESVTEEMQYAQKVLEGSDIVRDAIFRQLPLYPTGAHA